MEIGPVRHAGTDAGTDAGAARSRQRDGDRSFGGCERGAAGGRLQPVALRIKEGTLT